MTANAFVQNTVDYKFTDIHQRFMANRLRLARMSKGYSQAFVSVKLELGRSTLNTYESGLVVPSYGKMVEFSKLYGVPLRYFLYEFRGTVH